MTQEVTGHSSRVGSCTIPFGDRRPDAYLSAVVKSLSTGKKIVDFHEVGVTC